jgi:hypothetical protein
MSTIDGQQVFTETAELVDPAHTALVVIDPQNDFCAKAGIFACSGKDMSGVPRRDPRLRPAGGRRARGGHARDLRPEPEAARRSLHFPSLATLHGDPEQHHGGAGDLS